MVHFSSDRMRMNISVNGQVPMLRYRKDDAEVKCTKRSVYVFEEGCRCNQISVAISSLLPLGVWVY